MKKTWIIGCSMAAFAAMANVKPANVFSSNMVLQRDKVVPVWGTADAGEEVKVSFAGQSVAAKADADGRWEVKLQPMPASKENRTMVIEGKNKIEFKDILVGDVWLCSGQSNMEMSFNWGIYDGEAFKKEAAEKFDPIRCVKVSKIHSTWPKADVKLDHPWARTTANGGIANWTATGYFFARRLVQELDIPIGILDDNWSGCRIEPFIPLSSFKNYSATNGAYAKQVKSFLELQEKTDPRTEAGRKVFAKYAAEMKAFLAAVEAAVAEGKLPEADMPALPSVSATSQYNAMIAPIVRFPIAGAIWYQGCSNGQEGESYTEKTEMLVKGWREAWGYEFPFYWVQLASFTAKTDDPKGGNGYALIRDAQRLALKRLEKTGMAVTIDVGNDKDIHPKAKVFVGERLAAWALKGAYGRDVVPSGPLFREAEGLGTAEVTLSFDYVGGGLTAGEKDNLSNAPVKLLPDAKLVGFAAEVEGGQFVWADAKIAGDKVVVTAGGKTIRNVRYGYRANATGLANLYNREALPASPFATENKW
ncbi:MAG TPA: sialate O-acetylesterase [Kiritimatiellia bacterium]|nr:sialate O-acetylesterase [Kiritimatiellia bacterium]